MEAARGGAVLIDWMVCIAVAETETTEAVVMAWVVGRGGGGGVGMVMEETDSGGVVMEETADGDAGGDQAEAVTVHGDGVTETISMLGKEDPS